MCTPGIELGASSPWDGRKMHAKGEPARYWASLRRSGVDQLHHAVSSLAAAESSPGHRVTDQTVRGPELYSGLSKARSPLPRRSTM